ncbi:MAG: class I SAM-dependent methyltransferase [Magnetococcales bacterium]|nr:class I SAM-dependent methyltransferase [Magnetococcales bacterium]
MEKNIKEYLPLLSKQWDVDTDALERMLDDLAQDSLFLSGINAKIAGVQEFQGRSFSHPDDLRVYRILLYLVTRVFKPHVFVETGVQHGFGSAFILLAMHHNDRGELCSIDVPPLGDERITQQGTNPLPAGKSSGWVIPDGLRSRHRLVLAPAEQALPGVLAEYGAIDIFLHDSDHTYPHIMFEVGLAWKYLRPGGWIIIDNIEQNDAFDHFVVGVKGNGFSLASFDGPERLWKHGLLRCVERT